MTLLASNAGGSPSGSSHRAGLILLKKRITISQHFIDIDERDSFWFKGRSTQRMPASRIGFWEFLCNDSIQHDLLCVAYATFIIFMLPGLVSGLVFTDAPPVIIGCLGIVIVTVFLFLIWKVIPQENAERYASLTFFAVAVPILDAAHWLSPRVIWSGWSFVGNLVERFDIEAYSDFSAK